MSILDENLINITDHAAFPDLLRKAGFIDRGNFLVLNQLFEREATIIPINIAWKDGICFRYNPRIGYNAVPAWTLEEVRLFIYEIYKETIQIGYKIYNSNLGINYNINIENKLQLINYINQKINYHE